MNQVNDPDTMSTVSLTAINITGAVIGTYIWADFWLLALLALVCFIDFVTGIMASYRMDEDITSKRWIVGLFAKFSLIMTLFISGLVLCTYHEQVANYVIFFFIWMFTMAELYSAWSNTYTIRTGTREKEQDVVAITINKYKAVISALWGTDKGGTK
jgi:phage-related holin